MNHMVNLCLLTKYVGGLQSLHEAGDDTIQRLEIWQLQHLQNEMTWYAYYILGYHLACLLYSRVSLAVCVIHDFLPATRSSISVLATNGLVILNLFPLPYYYI